MAGWTMENPCWWLTYPKYMVIVLFNMVQNPIDDHSYLYSWCMQSMHLKTYIARQRHWEFTKEKTLLPNSHIGKENSQQQRGCSPVDQQQQRPRHRCSCVAALPCQTLTSPAGSPRSAGQLLRARNPVSWF